MSLFVQPDGVEAVKTLCMPALILATHDNCSIQFADSISDLEAAQSHPHKLLQQQLSTPGSHLGGPW
jgi:hypothetical protein